MGLQNDIFNDLKNQKFYLEKDLEQIYSGEMSFKSYKEKIEKISSILKEIAIIATAFNLVELYTSSDESIVDNNENSK